MSNQPSPHVQKLITLMQAEDMFRIAEMMQDGNYGAAYEKACNMDTAAREEIPMKVYRFLEEEANA